MPLDHVLGAMQADEPRTERRRGDDTRGRLLDAVEALIADHGFKPLTHRTIASRAEAHVALLNYHFGSKEQLIEEALARRAAQLLALQHGALQPFRPWPVSFRASAISLRREIKYTNSDCRV